MHLFVVSGVLISIFGYTNGVPFHHSIRAARRSYHSAQLGMLDKNMFPMVSTLCMCQVSCGFSHPELSAAILKAQYMLQSVVIDSNADPLASTTRIPLTLVSAVGLLYSWDEFEPSRFWDLSLRLNFCHNVFNIGVDHFRNTY